MLMKMWILMRTFLLCLQGQQGQCSIKNQDLRHMKDSGIWIWWPWQERLQNKSDQDRTYNYKNQETCKGHPNHNRRLPMKEILKNNKSQTIDNYNELVDQFSAHYKQRQSRETETSKSTMAKEAPINKPPTHNH